MINRRQVETNPYLKARGESQLRAKHAFERRAGWRFGLLFGIFILLMGYGWDAVQLFQLRAEYWWIHFALALVTILPLAILAGALAGFVNWYLKVLVWAAFGILAGWVAIHIPFEAARLVLQWLEPNLQQVEYLAIPKAAADSSGMLATLGALLGILVGLVQNLAVGAAWERSTEDFQLTPGGWAMLALSLPLAFCYALLFDGTSLTPLRAPMQTVRSIVQSGLNDPPGLDSSQIEIHRALIYLVGQSWRKNMSPDYTLHMAASEPGTVGEAFVDVAFSNGKLLRCRITTYGEFSGGCIDLNQTYQNYISEFLRNGTFECKDCRAQVSAQAAAWHQENARTLVNGDTTLVMHGPGSSVNVRVAATDGTRFECLLWGANPVVIEACQ